METEGQNKIKGWESRPKANWADQTPEENKKEGKSTKRPDFEKANRKSLKNGESPTSGP